MRRGERGKIKKKYGGRLKSYTVGVKLVSCKMLILYIMMVKNLRKLYAYHNNFTLLVLSNIYAKISIYLDTFD